MKKHIGSYPRVRVEGGGRGVVSQAGAVLLVETVRKTGLDTAISAALAPWRKVRAVHDPGKILLDVALAVALGGDCLADVGMLRAEPSVFGPVASDPTVSRLIGTLAAGGKRALAAIRTARAEVRQRVWRLAGDAAPDAGGQVIVDLDGVLVIAHSDKQDAAATWKKTFGHHPLMGFVDHGPGGSGEPVVGLLRPGNAGSNTAADHIEAAKLALAQLPKQYRRGRRTLIRADSGGGTHEFVAWLAQRGRWLSYSVGMTITDAIHHAVLQVPATAWTPAVEPMVLGMMPPFSAAVVFRQQLLLNELIEPVEIDVGEDGRCHTALGSPTQRGVPPPVFQVSGPEHGPDQPQEPAIVDLLPEDREHDLVVQAAEAVGDISLDEPARSGPVLHHVLQRGVTAPLGAEPVRAVRELDVVVRLQ
ncbi:hypothetical protein GCM10020367_12980 [Streptomyces sannanensis]|uniref:Transposase DDE domain-containing protein n=1 Tax=Streptomyces sannanensis TaxID=285536 RepID=A0ABP6S748_9ACTN